MISVLIPAFNAEPFVEEAIGSILAQSYEGRFEIVVLNDGSTDGTKAVLEKIAAQHASVRVRHRANGGVSSARNELMTLRSPEAQFVTFLDADDAFPTDRLKRDVSLLTDDAALDLVYGRLQLVDKPCASLMDVPPSDCICLRGISVTTATFRASTLDQIGPFNTAMTHGEDLDFLLRFFERSGNYALLDDVSVVYRRYVHGTATSDEASLQKGVMRALLQHGRRLRADPRLIRVDGIFEMERQLAKTEAPITQ